jgi:16S rRNA (cytosine1402-N4)-methyltransferase
MPVGARPDDKHAATRTFQALRIAVNDELTVLGHALESAVDRLAKGGTIAALSYHSIEDRIVKRLLAEKSGRGEGEGPYGTRPPALLELASRKPQEPSAAEVAANPRARSAKLRAARRL